MSNYAGCMTIWWLVPYYNEVEYELLSGELLSCAVAFPILNFSFLSCRPASLFQSYLSLQQLRLVWRRLHFRTSNAEYSLAGHCQMNQGQNDRNFAFIVIGHLNHGLRVLGWLQVFAMFSNFIFLRVGLLVKYDPVILWSYTLFLTSRVVRTCVLINGFPFFLDRIGTAPRLNNILLCMMPMILSSHLFVPKVDKSYLEVMPFLIHFSHWYWLVFVLMDLFSFVKYWLGFDKVTLVSLSFFKHPCLHVSRRPV